MAPVQAYDYESLVKQNPKRSDCDPELSLGGIAGHQRNYQNARQKYNAILSRSPRVLAKRSQFCWINSASPEFCHAAQRGADRVAQPRVGIGEEPPPSDNDKTEFTRLA